MNPSFPGERLSGLRRAEAGPCTVDGRAVRLGHFRPAGRLRQLTIPSEAQYTPMGWPVFPVRRGVMMSSLQTVLSIVWSLSLVSFAAAQSLQPDYFPISVGRSWEYDAVLDPVIGGPRRSQATTTIPREHVIRGDSYVILVTTVKGTPIGDVTEELHYRPSPAGVLRMTDADDAATLFLPRDVAVGDRWKTCVGGVELGCEAVAIEQVRGADGTVYDGCLRIVTRGGDGAGCWSDAGKRGPTRRTANGRRGRG